MQTSSSRRVVLATGNPGKIREMETALKSLGLLVIPASEMGIPEAIESGLTFVENAIIKARNAATHSGLPAIADDSGLEVDALDGAPGIYSSRYAGNNATDEDNNQRLLVDLQQVPTKLQSARFQCVIVYLRHEKDPTPLICTGSWEGRILGEEKGSNGFGYDPLFFVPSHGCASAELTPDVKNAISHRAQAMRCLVESLQNN
jgi:XTP/dITP diphosphohydrolase